MENPPSNDSVPHHVACRPVGIAVIRAESTGAIHSARFSLAEVFIVSNCAELAGFSGNAEKTRAAVRSTASEPRLMHRIRGHR
jgi:hypothetical protein